MPIANWCRRLRFTKIETQSDKLAEAEYQLAIGIRQSAML